LNSTLSRPLSKTPSFLFLENQCIQQTLKRGFTTTQSHYRPTFRGRTFGITILTVLQLLIGAIHIFFGSWLLTASQTTSSFFITAPSTVYSLYTVVFGFAAAFFAFGIWLQKKWGLYGTIVLLLFVIVLDALDVLNLPSILGIPTFAAGPEILYSLIVMLYLLQAKVKTK
jgi:hypothetical protein